MVEGMVVRACCVRKVVLHYDSINALFGVQHSL